MNHNSSQKIYTCPMHPEIQEERPGMCPECGMNLVKNKPPKTAGREAHDKHAGHSTSAFLKKFWVSLALTIPILAYSEIAEKVFRWHAPRFPGYSYVLLFLGSVVFFYGGWVFIAGAYRELRAKLPGMMTLIAIAIAAAYSFSVFSVITGREHTLFWELSTLIAVMLLGHWFEMKAVVGAQGALRELSKLLPDTAEVIIQNAKIPEAEQAHYGAGKNENEKFKNETRIIPIAELKEGDIVLVRPGGRIPADGIVVEGNSEANEAMVTGESAPVPKKETNKVIAGTVNGDGSLKVRVTNIGERTFLAGVMRLVREAQASKSRLQILSDRAAFYLTLIALGAGGLTFLLWLLADAGLEFALERLVAVLVIACPHALGLAVPLVASISTTLAARHGFLVKQRLSLEAARNIDIVLFDKTGTLTKGEYGVTDILSVTQIPNSKSHTPNQSQIQNSKSQAENYILQLAASVDSHSEHFAAQAIVSEAKNRGLKILEVSNFSRLPGRGVRGVIAGDEVLVGGHSIFDGNPPSFSAEMEKEIERENQNGKTIVFVLKNGAALGAFALADLIREESRQAVQDLKALGVRVAMVTGDSEDVAKWVARALDIKEYFARVLPHEKSEKVKLLQSREQKVAMVGDGVNDAPALTQADLGIAIGAGTNVAIESAGIILVRNDPRDIVKIIKLSRLTYSKMIQNLFWATGYNIVALPLAAGVLAPQGIMLQPAVAALFMSLSTVIVAVNALLLRKQTL